MMVDAAHFFSTLNPRGPPAFRMQVRLQTAMRWSTGGSRQEVKGYVNEIARLRQELVLQKSQSSIALGPDPGSPRRNSADPFSLSRETNLPT